MTRIQYVDGGGPIECEYLGITSTTGAGTEKSATVSFGSAAAGRKLFFAVHAGYAGGSISLSAAEIGGVAASIVAGAVGDQSGVLYGVWLICAEVPSGTSGVVKATFSNSGVSCAVAGYRTLNVRSLAVHDKGELPWNSSSTDTRMTDADTPQDGLFIAASSTYHDGGTTTLSGVPVAYHAGAPSGPAHYFGGFEIVTSAEPGKSATVTKSGGAGSMAGGLIVASFR